MTGRCFYFARRVLNSVARCFRSKFTGCFAWPKANWPMPSEGRPLEPGSHFRRSPLATCRSPLAAPVADDENGESLRVRLTIHHWQFGRA